MTAAAEPVLAVKGLVKTYGALAAVDGVSLEDVADVSLLAGLSARDAVAAFAVFAGVYRYAILTGLVARYSAETVS